MASASLLYLLYSGLQEDRLIPPKGVPKIDTFQKVFRKTGRFSTEWYRLNFDGKPSFGTTARATIPRRGHLVTRAFLVTVMPDIKSIQDAALSNAPPGYTVKPAFGWTNSLGHALVQESQVTIAGEPIDKIDGRLLEMLDEFHTPLEKVTVVNRMIGRHDSGFSAISNGHSSSNQEIITPLPFWFMRGDPSAALPIDAISIDSVQISIKFSSVNSLYVSDSHAVNNIPIYTPLTNTIFTYTNGSNVITSTTVTSTSYDIVDSYILLEYVYLDKPEASRIRLANITYPIVQHYAINPFDTKGATFAKIPMRIPNLTRDLYFMAHRPEADAYNAPFLATRDLGLTTSNVPWWPDATGLGTEYLPDFASSPAGISIELTLFSVKVLARSSTTFLLNTTASIGFTSTGYLGKVTPINDVVSVAITPFGEQYKYSQRSLPIARRAAKHLRFKIKRRSDILRFTLHNLYIQTLTIIYGGESKVKA